MPRNVRHARRRRSPAWDRTRTCLGGGPNSGRCRTRPRTPLHARGGPSKTKTLACGNGLSGLHPAPESGDVFRLRCTDLQDCTRGPMLMRGGGECCVR
eukprot:7382023-Prymnesium_polylepis.1